MAGGAGLIHIQGKPARELLSELETGWEQREDAFIAWHSPDLVKFSSIMMGKKKKGWW